MLSGPEERCSCSTKPPGSFTLASGRLREEKRRVPSTSGRGRCWGGLGCRRGSASALTTCRPVCRAVGKVPGVQHGQCFGPAPRTPARRAPCPRHARLQRDQQIKLILFVKGPALKIKNNKARETENANLTAASEEGCSTEPEQEIPPPSFSIGLGFFFLSIRVARKFSELRSAVLIVIAFEFN